MPARSPFLRIAIGGAVKGRAEQEPLKQGLPLEEEVKVASSILEQER